ncbi:hypothetical protein HK405_005003 [Cladochytrium tenue]|nr:hypothetical protein HK405_005003 [Cladochytrium tenue]
MLGQAEKPDTLFAEVEDARAGVSGESLWSRIRVDPGLGFEAFRDEVVAATMTASSSHTVTRYMPGMRFDLLYVDTANKRTFRLGRGEDIYQLVKKQYCFRVVALPESEVVNVFCPTALTLI